MDVVYVIYLDGKMLESRGRKVAYLRVGDAKRIVTDESKIMAEDQCDTLCWYELTRAERNKRIEECKKRFEIREFIERR